MVTDEFENLKPFAFTYNGKTFIVLVKEELRNEFAADPNKRQEYAKAAYEALNKPQIKPETTSKAPTNPVPTSAEDSFSDNSHNFKWTHELTTLLVQLRLNREEEFVKRKCKKTKLWHQIADQFYKKSGVRLSSGSCDIKFRNLLATYRANKKKLNSGDHVITWEHFSLFDSVLGNNSLTVNAPNASINIKTESTFESFENIDQPDNIPNIIDETESNESVIFKDYETETDYRHETMDDQAEGAEPSRIKKKRFLSMGEYLFLKNEREEKEMTVRLKMQEEQLKEKMKLKAMEVNALIAIANALANASTNLSSNSQQVKK